MLLKLKTFTRYGNRDFFVHGSMCFAYSGRCLVSAVQMGRVPNRGSCANDCRFNILYMQQMKIIIHYLDLKKNQVLEHIFSIQKIYEFSYLI